MNSDQPASGPASDDADLPGSNGSEKRTSKPKKKRAAPPLIDPMIGLTTLTIPSSTTVPAVPIIKELIEPTPAAHVDRGLPLPEHYGMDRLVALTRDPASIFCYWELHGPALGELHRERGSDFLSQCAWVLRVYRLNEGLAIDVEIDPSVGNWYVCVDQPGSYQFELALLSPDGEWVSLLASRRVAAPSPKVSDRIDSEWVADIDDAELLGSDLTNTSSRGASGFLGASHAPSSFMGSSELAIGSSASGRPVAGSWQSLGSSSSVSLSANSLTNAGVNSGTELTRPGIGATAPNWNQQSNLPSVPAPKTQQPQFKVKLPRVIYGINPPAPTWPPASAGLRSEVVRVQNKPSA